MPTPLADLLQALERIAPLDLAEDWDNVGLLVEVPEISEIAHCTLTIDLSEKVLQEAIGSGSQLLVAYHPPIFAPLKRLTRTDAKQRIVVDAIRAGISIYSPHTALDTATEGVNDWLADGFGPSERRGIPEPEPGGHAIGRALSLTEPASLDDCVGKIKEHLGLAHVRVAAAFPHRTGSKVRTVALCAGAGATVIAGEPADLYLTGEMRHHDVLAANERGTSVVLCDHTNTERGYLPTLRSRLAKACPDVAFAIATEDEEPLQVM